MSAQKRMHMKAKGRLPGMEPEGLGGVSVESSLSFLGGSLEDSEQREEKELKLSG